MVRNRKSSEELPSKDEIGLILGKEEYISVPKTKRCIHYVDYSTVVNLCECLEINTFLFTEKNKYFESIDDFFVEAKSVLNVAVIKILQNDSCFELYNALYDYLSEEDDLANITGDILFVFGSKTTLRMQKAIDLYKQGVAEQILVSGRGPSYEKIEIMETEAETLRDFAVSNGVSESDIYVETKAITIPDNIKRSLKLLKLKNIKHKKIILVNSPFSQRRGWAHFNKFSDGIEFVRINSNVGEVFSRNGWYKSESGIRIILNEFIKMRGAELLNTI